MHIIFELYFTPHFYQNIFSMLPVPSALRRWRIISGFQVRGIGQRNQCWTAAVRSRMDFDVFLGRPWVSCPNSKTLLAQLQSISHSFPAIHSCQRLFPYTEGRQIISKPEKILIELLFHPSLPGFLPENPIQNSSDRKGMNRIKLSIFIFFFLSTVWFSYFKKADYRTY